MFIASGRRIRELPVYEYMWLREWLLSWQEDGAGELRGLLAERMWPAALGCPEDIYSNSTESGCRSGMRFMSGRESPSAWRDNRLPRFSGAVPEGETVCGGGGMLALATQPFAVRKR